MALFSRRKNESDELTDPTPAGAEIGEERGAVADTPAEDVPQVGISMSTFGGLGQPAAPAAPAAPPVPAAVDLPFAPSDPPTVWETVPGLRDNAVLRDALARLEEDPSPAALLGVARQTLQGHMFLRVLGDAREQMEKGEPLSLGVVRDGDRNFMLAFSGGKALQEAVSRDGDAATSAVGQPAQLVFQHMLSGDFAGLILDTASGSARAVLPRELIQRAMDQSDPEFRVKTLVAGERDADTVPGIVAALAEAPMWVAVGQAGEENGEPIFGVAEVRTEAGDRLLQVFTHPLEVIALGRDERPAPFSPEQLRDALNGQPEISGLLIDTAGPSIRLSRAELAPFLAG